MECKEGCQGFSIWSVPAAQVIHRPQPNLRPGPRVAQQINPQHRFQGSGALECLRCSYWARAGGLLLNAIQSVFSLGLEPLNFIQEHPSRLSPSTENTEDPPDYHELLVARGLHANNQTNSGWLSV